ncbi:MAG: hypothetical protein MPW14_13920 [Candidatus Manganitrophus sp.]|nr:MAG: hypothetical protein MPW14_13920 [Candidatus Manganitrophus sp.]
MLRRVGRQIITDEIAADKLQLGIDLLVAEQEPTMVIIPDAVLLPPAGLYQRCSGLSWSIAAER